MQLANPVKEALRAGGSAVGVFITIPAPEIVEIFALAGFDFVLIDAEHGPISPESAYPMVLAAEANGIPAFARVGQNDRQVILKFLDIGVAGVMIPQVATPTAAAEAVAAMRYRPRGLRGLAGGRSFSWGLAAPARDLVPKINDRVLSLVQFEHISALDHLEAILRTPDLDVLFVGPNDLAQSMDLPGQPDHPEVEAVIAQVLRRAQGSSVALATTAPNAAAANRRLEQGFRMVVASATGLLAAAARDYVAGVRR